MAVQLPKLPNYIAVPDYPPHCPVCGFRAIDVGDFFHTNYKGGIYMCVICEKRDKNLFIEQEDIDFSIDYWIMSQKNRRVYTDLTEEGKIVFSKFTKSDRKKFFGMKKGERTSYVAQLIRSSCLFFDLPTNYIETLKNT
jgi:hypothetical protein